MSRNVEYDLRALRDQETLLAALAEVGYGPDKVQVHEQPVSLRDEYGRPFTASIVIPHRTDRLTFWNAAGFKRNADGTFTAYADQHEGGDQFIKNVTAAYGRINANKTLKWLLTKKIPGMKARGEVPRNATIQQMKVGADTRVRLHW